MIALGCPIQAAAFTSLWRIQGRKGANRASRRERVLDGEARDWDGVMRRSWAYSPGGDRVGFRTTKESFRGCHICI